jgi:hypothetical protein
MFCNNKNYVVVSSTCITVYAAVQFSAEPHKWFDQLKGKYYKIFGQAYPIWSPIVRMGDGQYGRVHARVSSKQTKKLFWF